MRHMKSVASVLSVIALGFGLLSCTNSGGGGGGGGGGTSSSAFLYVANSGGNDISAYGVNTTTGVLTPLAGSPFAAGTNPQAVTINASGSVAFASNAGSADVLGYVVDGGTG